MRTENYISPKKVKQLILIYNNIVESYKQQLPKIKTGSAEDGLYPVAMRVYELVIIDLKKILK